MGSNFSMKYDVDIVMCIDATGSMGPMINMVKENALSFYKDFKAIMDEKGKNVSQVRIRVIAFRDYLADGDQAMMMTGFFNLPEQIGEFEEVVRRIEPMGGGDNPEDGLEALAYAIKSKWNNSEGKKRHVIVVWTDDATHDLGFGRKAANYPAKMAKDFNELSEWWGVGQSPNAVMNKDYKRLLIYAPPLESWSTIANTWDNVLMFPTAAGQGLDDTVYSEILHTICESC